MLLPSGKTPASKYDLKAVDPTKILPDLDMRILGALFQRAMQETYGYSIAGNLGASSAIDEDLNIVTKANLDDFAPYLAKLIQTYVANNSFLEVDASSTANSIILNPRKISDIVSPNGNNYSSLASLPFAYRDNLSFTFRAKDTSTSTVQIQITGLAGLSGAIDVVDELGSSSVTIVENRFYQIVLTGTSGTKKAVIKNIGATLAEAIAGTNNTKFLTPYLSSNLPIVRVAKTTPQNLVDSVWTKITGFSIDLNVGNYWNAGTQKFIPPAGTYQLNLGTNAVGNQNYGNVINLYKNGSPTIFGLQVSGVANQQNKVAYSEVVTANGTDEFEVYSLMFGAGTLTLQETIFLMYKIR